MAWPKGKSREKTGGRKPGTPNKRTRDLLEILDERGFCAARALINTYRKAMKEYDRYDQVCNKIMDGDPEAWKAARGMHDQSPRWLDIAQGAAKELMNYSYPKRKAIELTGKDGGPLDAYLRMTPEERAAKRAEIQARLKKAG